jgi:stage V sporulation protein SpoVS
VYQFNAQHQDWALVKTVANTYGFIDTSGKEVVQAIYSKIYDFEIQKDGKKYAMIKNVADAFGYIDENGKEIVEAIYWNKEEAIQKLNYNLTSK